MGNGPMYNVDFELRLRQFDRSEHSVEMRYMMSAHMLALFCLAAFLARFALRCRVLRRGAGQLHAVIWVLAAGTGLQWAGHCLHVLHLAAYSANGVGAPGVDLLAEVFFMLSQVVSATLFIAIAQGY